MRTLFFLGVRRGTPAFVRRILVIDDHQLFADGLAALLGSLGSDIRVRSAASVEEALELPSGGAAMALVLLDLNLPGLHGEAAFSRIRRAFPDAPLAIVSSEEEPGLALRVLRRGAVGYLPKSTPGRIMTAAVGLLLAGGTYLPPLLLDIAVDPSDEIDAALTERQRAVLLALARGQSTREIAETLGASEATVRVHLSAVLKTLGVTTRAQAAATPTAQRLLATTR